jgi:hypothetical protein
MNIDKIKLEVARIDAMKGDYEIAHSAEDSLRDDFILYVAEHGESGLAEMAREVLKTNELDFARHCA